ncbi:MAG: DNA translocase FtsK [Bdellovibrionia bacterium]
MGNRKNIGVEIGSILIFALGVFVFFSLVSFHESDPGFWIKTAGLAKNACGRIGASLARGIFSVLGMGAFLIPMALFLSSAAIHRKQKPTELLLTLGGLSSAVVSLTVFLSLQWSHWLFGGAQLSTGGKLGDWISHSLSSQLNSVGASLVALLIFLLAVSLSTSIQISDLGARVISWVMNLLLHAGRAMGRALMSLGLKLVTPIVDGVKTRVQSVTQSVNQFFRRSFFDLFQSSLWRKSNGPLPPQVGGFLEDSLGSDAALKKPEGIEGGDLFSSASPEVLGSAQAPTQITSALSLKEQEVTGGTGIQILPRSKELHSSASPTQRASKPIFRPKTGQWKLPTVEFLKKPPHVESSVDRARLISNSQILKQKFADFGIDGEVTAVRPGPVITLYEFKPGPGVKVSRIAALADDLSMALSAQSVRILAPLPGKSVVGIEIPSDVRETVYLREFLQHPDFYGPKHSIPVVMGKDIGGQTYLSDLARMPHLLCAGQTGSGKSVFMNGLICSLFYRFTPDELRMILVDPKFIEFRAYQDMPHLLLPVVDDPKQANTALKWAVREMDRRYRILAKVGARNLAAFNQKIEEMGASVVADLLNAQESENESSLASVSGRDWIEAFEPDDQGAPKVGKLPYIVIIIDELADLMMLAKKEVEISIARIAQKARAAGIHLIIATQRPSTDVVTGLIIAKLPSRVSFQLASFVDSKTILDRAGAERLLGQGDMLFVPPGVSQTLRLHGAFLEDEEINKITSFLKSQGKPVYRDEILLSDDEEEGQDAQDAEAEDELFRDAIEVVKTSGHASASFLQRHFKIGYNRAARMIETMESRGIVGPQDGARPREIFIR